MEIQSAFNSGVQGLQQATAAADKAAANIVAETTAQETNAVQEADSSSQTQTSNQQPVPELNQSLVDLKVAEFQAKASTEVIKSADDSLGTLLDVTA
ncbi:MAG: hypothetical protein COB83_10240 [Gammaproteobacteria bacterium]|nr:MAG: hypothetical protein COB83_10240 [Gammaproteobacteria bacterium]